MGDDLSLARWANSNTTRTGAITCCFMNNCHGDNRAGQGASHQPGWTGLVAKLIQQAYAPEPTKPTGILDWAVKKRGGMCQ